MTEEFPAAARRPFEARDAFAPGGQGYEVETTVFDATVTVAESGRDDGHDYTVRVQVPSLDAATADHVGPAVQTGWFETMQRRLADAPSATRASVDLDGFDLAEDDGTVAVTYRFSWTDPGRAAAVAKTFVEYVEGTYVESVIPGYEYEPPVADLLSQAASRGGDGSRGSTPL